MDKICIIGIDALEYDFVKKWNLKNLKQKEYDKINLLVDYAPPTPVIWTSFITGQKPKDHGITSDRIWDSKIIEWVSSFKKFFLRSLGIDLFPAWVDRNLAKKIGIKYRAVNKKDLNSDTIFDFFEQNVAIGIPCYNEWKEDLELRNVLVETEAGKVPKKELKNMALKVFESKKEETFKKLKKKWKIFMTYFYVLDPIQHVFYYDEDFIKDMYKEMNSLVSKIKKQLDKKTLVLIIADHGLKKGKHTGYGFYSSNKKLKLKNPKITDFFGLIKNVLGAPTREDEEKIKKHLKELGYF